ncbi:MAG TPA: LamG-like jellyroll fold domain-containing protein, partial [Verrucomicrobiae bacterium]
TFWAAEGFNEPDYSPNREGSPQNLDQIFAYLQASTNFSGTAMEGGSTLNDDDALSWFNSIVANASMGSTHCLAGSASSYVNFIQSVAADNAMPFNPELHNVMEAVMGANYGLRGGIWWGSAELARGSFVKACQGKQLGYADNLNNWTAAAVYRGTNGAVQAFLGGSERMATTTTYRLFSRDRNVFYNGYGPQRDYIVTVPGGTGYQVNQPSMEQVVNINWGADVPPPIAGRYVVANRNNGQVLGVAFNTTNSLLAPAVYTGASNQIWDIYPMTNNAGGDVSYYTMTAESDGEMANLSSWSYANGVDLQVWPAVDSVQENWIFQYASNGCFYVRSRMSDLYMVASGGTIVQWNSLNGLSEQWRLIPVGNIAPTGLAISFTAPAAPTGLTATANPVSVQLNWNTNSGSAPVTYTVLSSTNSGGPYNVIARGLTNTMFLDNSANQAQTYYYVVAAVSGALSQSAYSAQASATPTLAPTLVADYSFQSNNLDSSGNNNNAELAGSPEFVPGLNLDGTNEYAMAPAGIMAATTNFTIAAWVYWNGGAEWQRIFDFGNNTTQYMFLTPNSGNGTLRFAVTTNGNGAEQRVETSELPVGQWVHLAVTLNGTTASLYTNGVLAATGPDTIPPSAFNPALNNIGASQFSGDPYFSGLIKSFLIDNYALSASQILSLAVPPIPAPMWATGGNGRVSVAWGASVGATSYVVERSSTNGGPYATIASGITGTTYTDTTAANGTTYYYIVQALGSTGGSPASGQIIATPNSSLPNLSDYWRFDEGFGITAYDSIGTNNGTLGSGCSWIATGVDNGAVSFDGSANAYVSYPPGLVSRLTNFTISAWVNLNASNAWQRIFDFGSGTGTFMFLTPEAGAGGPLWFAITTNGSGAAQEINGPAGLSVGTWHEVAVTMSNGLGVLYLDGTAVGTNSNMTLTPSALGQTTANTIGQSQFSEDPHLTGSVDDFRIYPSALNAQQVATLATLPSSELTMTVTNGAFVFAWDTAGINGAGTVLESNTNLVNSNGWIPVSGAVASPYVVPIPASGNAFYRLVP